MTSYDNYERQQTIDRMHWITDPGTHRAHAERRADELGQDGDTITTTFGEAILIRPPVSVEWICDFCNEIILTVNPVPSPFYTSAMPVAAVGGYALCGSCSAIILADVGLDTWPQQSCGCPPCRDMLTTFMLLEGR